MTYMRSQNKSPTSPDPICNNFKYRAMMSHMHFADHFAQVLVTLCTHVDIAYIPLSMSQPICLRLQLFWLLSWCSTELLCAICAFSITELPGTHSSVLSQDGTLTHALTF